MSSPSVMVMAAGTGGHIFPGLAVAHSLDDRGASVSWLGTPQGLENRVVPPTGIHLDRIPIEGLRGRGLLGWLAAPLRIARAMLAARRVFIQQRPSCVLSMGGYVAGPGGVMAWIMGIPLIVHEQNAIAGLTNRLLRPLARRVMTGFPETLKHGEHCGNPVRSSIAELPPPEQRYRDREGPLRVLVIGGSLGAAAFARTIPLALARLEPDRRPVITHQAGRQLDATRDAYAEAGVDGQVVEFIDRMEQAWGEADLAICRAGALTVAELAAAGVPAILVPFPYAVDDHQTANARYLTDGGAGWLMPESDFGPERLAEQLAGLTRDQLASMADKARALARPRADERVAAACLEVAR